MITRTRWRKGRKVQVLLTSEEQRLFVNGLRHALGLDPLYEAEIGDRAKTKHAVLGLERIPEAAE